MAETPQPVPSEKPAAAPDSSTALEKEKLALEQAKIVLEEYKLYVDSMEKAVARRQAAHSFFLSAHGLLLTALGLIGKDLLTSRAAAIPLFVTAVVGAVLCYFWQQLCVWYGQLNEAKFQVIHALEARLPEHPFLDEWHALKQGLDPKVYVSFSKTESNISYVFYAAYLAAMIGALAAWFLHS